MKKAEQRTIVPALLTAHEAAKMLTIGESTLWKMVKDGELPVVRLRRNVRFDPEALKAWIAQHNTTIAPPLPGEAGLSEKSEFSGCDQDPSVPLSRSNLWPAGVHGT
jgi:excisionase family DNA binding protein